MGNVRVASFATAAIAAAICFGTSCSSDQAPVQTAAGQTAAGQTAAGQTAGGTAAIAGAGGSVYAAGAANEPGQPPSAGMPNAGSAAVGASGGDSPGGAPAATSGAGGGSSGGVGSVGGGEGGALSLVQPIARANGQYVLEFGDLYFALDPQVGARIVGLRLLGGSNLLTGPAVNADGFGSTFRISPQSAWNAVGWPPPPEIDSQPYAMSALNQMIVGVSAPSESLGATVTKRFTPLLGRQAILATYTIQAAAGGKSFAPWEVTRVFPGGLTFYPTGEGAPFTSGTFSLPVTQTALGCTWFKYPASVGASQRLIADGKDGWLAHVTPDGFVLIKRFTDIARSEQAPGEGEISIYVDGSGKFIELENQGAYQVYARGQTVSWDVTWYVRKLPTNIAMAVGNQALLDFVRAVVSGSAS